MINIFSNEEEALDYINQNKELLLSQLKNMELKTIYSNENTRINILKNRKQLIKFINRYTGEKHIAKILKEIIDLKRINEKLKKQ